MKSIAILGSTGSIGTQTLDVVRQHPERFRVFMLSARNNAALLVQQAISFQAAHVVICNPEKYAEVRAALPATVQVHQGIDAACALVQEAAVDVVVAAMVGFSGLRPTLAALAAGKTVALANKETLVAAGQLVMAQARRSDACIFPVDSEHSAIFQCLAASPGNPVAKVHLTASGGPFRTWSREQIAAAGKDQALRHPNWDMGAKVTIDSSTLMNKGFEVIEARWLFNLSAPQIHVLVHPESVIHSMVEFADGAVIAQLGVPDMRVPIALALSWPKRLSLEGERLDFSALKGLSFFEPDREKFPCLQLAFEALSRGGNIPCALNAANEAAVAAYLEGRIGFYDIPRGIGHVMEGIGYQDNPSLEDIFATHEEAFRRAQSFFGL